jgi:hypothetical protein
VRRACSTSLSRCPPLAACLGQQQHSTPCGGAPGRGPHVLQQPVSLSPSSRSQRSQHLWKIRFQSLGCFWIEVRGVGVGTLPNCQPLVGSVGRRWEGCVWLGDAFTCRPQADCSLRTGRGMPDWPAALSKQPAYLRRCTYVCLSDPVAQIRMANHNSDHEKNGMADALWTFYWHRLDTDTAYARRVMLWPSCAGLKACLSGSSAIS